jgi:hypothetical protein
MISKTQHVNFRSLSTTVAILIVISVVNVMGMFIRGYLAELELRNAGFSISHWSPYRAESVLLVFAATCLIGNRFWILLLSILASGSVLYLLSYVRWRGLANAYEVPMFSWLMAETLLRSYLDHLEIIFELILASATLICGCVLLRRFANERQSLSGTGG